MPTTTIERTDAINVVGAGIFGLSTTLHLARRGYQNVTLYDKQPYDKTLYSYLNGCDAASAGALYLHLRGLTIKITSMI